MKHGPGLRVLLNETMVTRRQDCNPTYLPKQKRALRRGLAKRNMNCARYFILDALMRSELTSKERFQMRKMYNILNNSLFEFQQGTAKLGYKQKLVKTEDQI